MGFQMVDRGKFKVFQSEDYTKNLIQQSVKEAETKKEEAATPTDAGRDQTNLAECMGRAVKVRDFKATLLKLNPDLVFQLSKGDPSKYGVYVKGLVWDKTLNRMVVGLRHICGMESGSNIGTIDDGVMPEFSVILADDEIVPDGDTIKKVKKFRAEIRGWRTVLAALYLERLITESQIEAHFKISQGRDSENWATRIGAHVAVSGS
jgi:hypothetical protein